jgi:alginate O-acetyltransferase complex protein AlgI
MLFNSFDFLIFFTISLGVLRWMKLQKILVIIILSLLFYAYWDYRFLPLVLMSSVLDFTIGQKIENSRNQVQRKLLLALSIFCNLSVLSYFKYFNFLSQIFVHHNLDFTVQSVAIPLGISFYTFQTMSYSVDVYRGILKAEKNFEHFLFYVLYFPQLIAGPIEKYTDIKEQLIKPRIPSLQISKKSLYFITLGLFKKVVIADRIAVIVESYFYDPSGYSSLGGILNSFLYSMQIYYDFSGYCEIAMGISLILGIELTRNFRFPYHSKSLSEFWINWHFSLGRWFKEYAYIPMRKRLSNSSFAISTSLLTVFLLSGLWHGANITFLIWGAFHGLTISLEKRFNLSQYRAYRFVLPLIFVFYWIPFRALSLNGLKDIFYNLTSFQAGFLHQGSNLEFVFVLIFGLALVCVEPLLEKAFDKKTDNFKSSVIGLMAYACMVLGVFENNTFIYFQF